MKHPYMQFYTGDWLKDPQLSLCSPATRGIWTDIICAIHERDNGGVIEGQPRELARLCRCDSAEMEAAINEIERTGTGDVERLLDGTVRVRSRRLQRDLELKQKRSHAGSKGGSKTQAKREQIPDYEDEDEGLLKVRTFCTEAGIAESDADWFFWKCHANGWKNGGAPIKDWKSTLRSWQRAGYLPSQKTSGRYPQTGAQRKESKASGQYPSNVDRSKIIR